MFNDSLERYQEPMIKINETLYALLLYDGHKHIIRSCRSNDFHGVITLCFIKRQTTFPHEKSQTDTNDQKTTQLYMYIQIHARTFVG